MRRRKHAVKLKPLWQCLSPAASTPPICELVIVDNRGGASPDCQEVERHILLSSLHLDSVGQPRSRLQSEGWSGIHPEPQIPTRGEILTQLPDQSVLCEAVEPLCLLSGRPDWREGSVTLSLSVLFWFCSRSSLPGCSRPCGCWWGQFTPLPVRRHQGFCELPLCISGAEHLDGFCELLPSDLYPQPAQLIITKHNRQPPPPSAFFVLLPLPRTSDSATAPSQPS